MKKSKKGGFGKGLFRALKHLDKVGKQEAQWFFGPNKTPYEPEREMMGGWEDEANEMFGFKKRKQKNKSTIVVINT